MPFPFNLYIASLFFKIHLMTCYYLIYGRILCEYTKQTMLHQKGVHWYTKNSYVLIVVTGSLWLQMSEGWLITAFSYNFKISMVLIMMGIEMTRYRAIQPIQPCLSTFNLSSISFNRYLNLQGPGIWASLNEYQSMLLSISLYPQFDTKYFLTTF